MNSISKDRKIVISALYAVSMAVGIYGVVVCALISRQLALLYAAPFIAAAILTAIQAAVLKVKGLNDGTIAAETVIAVIKTLIMFFGAVFITITLFAVCLAGVILLPIIVMIAETAETGLLLSVMLLAFLTALNGTVLNIAVCVLEISFASKGKKEYDAAKANEAAGESEQPQ